MVVNNWYITTNMLCDVVKEDTSKTWPKVFISSFWVIVVLVVSNLILANLIEIRDDRAVAVHKEFEKRRKIKALRNHLKDKDAIEYSEKAFNKGMADKDETKEF